MLAVASTGQIKIDTTPIILDFVVNLDFIPKHRCLSLFKALLEALGLERHIPVTLMLLAEKSCQSTEKAKIPAKEFAVDLTNSFALVDRLKVLFCLYSSNCRRWIRS